RGASRDHPHHARLVLRPPLRSGSLYVGATTNLEQRFADHQAGRACRSTRLDPPLGIVHVEELPTFSAARLREAQVK
ncbi:MAG: hypothetical protein EHM91_17370, partial [Planctomycetota bacterium]